MILEEYFNHKNIKGKYQGAVALETANALISFCYQEPEFEQAIEQSGKSFQECLDDAVKGIKSSCSDFEVFSRAVKFIIVTIMTISSSARNLTIICTIPQSVCRMISEKCMKGCQS